MRSTFFFLFVQRFLFSSDTKLCPAKLNLGYKMKDFSTMLSRSRSWQWIKWTRSSKKTSHSTNQLFTTIICGLIFWYRIRTEFINYVHFVFKDFQTKSEHKFVRQSDSVQSILNRLRVQMTIQDLAEIYC